MRIIPATRAALWYVAPIIAVTIDILRRTVVDASGTTADVTPTTSTLHQGSRPPTAAAATTTPPAVRPEPAAQGPSSGRRPRRRNAPPTTRVAAVDDADDTAEFPVTFKSADLFAVTKVKLYSTFTISMKVCLCDLRIQYVHWSCRHHHHHNKNL